MSVFNKIFNVETYKNFQKYRGIQNVYTPLEKISKLTDFDFTSLISANTKTIGILFNFEFIDYLLKNVNKDYISNINITFFYDSKFDLEEAKFIAYRYNFNNILFESIENFSESKNIKDLDKVMAGKKFDIVFSNPPYNDNLDLKILKSLFEENTVGNLVFVHPAGYLLDKKFKTKLYNELRNTNYLESVSLFWGNNLFDIKLFCPCCISVWNSHKTDDKCTVNDKAFIRWTDNEPKYTCKINDISIHGKIFEKVKYFLKYDNNLLDHITNENELTDYSVRFALIRGGSDILKSDSNNTCEHFYSFIGLDVENYKCDHTFKFSEASKHSGQPKSVFSFNNEIERENFLNYCKSKFVRFLMSLTKHGANITRGELSIIPWLDFTQEWNDAKLCKEFGISEELWNYIDNFIPDYYNDYVSGF